jgi:Rieske Fe-S protein
VTFRDNNFTDNMASVASQYATAAGIETDDEGKAPHIDVPNEDQNGEPVDLANVGVPTDTVVEEEPETPADPDDLTEEELEEATAPESETEEEQA